MNRAALINRVEQKVITDAREDSFDEIAALWSVYLHRPLIGEDVAMMMILLKVARVMKCVSIDDSLVDIAGYAACAAEIWEKDLNAQHGLETIAKADAEAKQKAVEDAALKEAHNAYDLLHGLR